MKIDSYDLNVNSQRKSIQASYESNRFTALETVVPAPAEDTEEAAQLELSEKANEAMKQAQDGAVKDLSKYQKTSNINMTGQGAKVPSSPLEAKLSLLEQMIYALTGKRMNFKPFTLETGSSNGNGDALSRAFSNAAAAQGTGGAKRQEFSMVSESFHHESESMTFTAQGVINTADGQTINVDVAMHLSREYTSYSKTSVKLEPVMMDPLVINYDGSAASLSGEKFEFDLDFDGKMDNIYFAGQGSGFLALDKNGDGKINDGSELFGPQSGNGFDELRKYDGDKNGWIDENDEVYSKLRVWSKDKDGNDQLFTLKELDIGAIYLGDIDTEFSFKDGDNSTKGTMRSTSIFLKDSGGAGTVSHIDLSL